MWRSNVLRLRTCSSAFVIQHVKKRWHSVGADRAVSKIEFLRALEKAYSRLALRGSQSWTIGLAISGGVDSMALATLYAKVAAADKTMPPCHAFIIDHKVRAESTEEAEWVKQQLHWKLDIPATIIPLTWPAYDPYASNFRRFESDARKLRYQALGQACKEQEISALMVAHHADDQAETVLMRLMMKRWRSGLQGMQAAEWIPECYGMHGVHRSGSLNIEPGLPMPVEGGGIQILRPLLGFPKSRLIATCNNQGMAWAEDKSNQDHTLTARNAIRYVFKEHQLPAALSTESLVALGEKMKSRVDHHKKRVEELMRELIYKLDVQTGSLSVRFPPASALLGRPILSDKDINEARNTAYMFLERVAEFVSFRDNTTISKLSSVVPAIYPELAEDKDNIKSVPTATSLCAFGLWWRRWDTPAPHIFPKLPKQKPHPMDWLLSRQPPESHELGRSGLRLEFPPPPATLPLVSTTSVTDLEWHLYDRWWIQVKNLTQDHTVVLRFLTDEELRAIPGRNKNPSQLAGSKDNHCDQESDPYHNIKISLNLIKPASLRRHLPALFLVSPEGKEELVALPTLGAKTIFPKERSLPNPPCTWDIRYKKIDVGHRKLQDIIVPGIHSEDETFHTIKRLDLKRLDTASGSKEDNKSWTGNEKGVPSRSREKSTRCSQKEKAGFSNRTVKVDPLRGFRQIGDKNSKNEWAEEQRVEKEKPATWKRVNDGIHQKEDEELLGEGERTRFEWRRENERNMADKVDKREDEGLAFLESESRREDSLGKRKRR